MIFEIIKVDSYSGHRSNERPVAFQYRDQCWEVEEIIDCWYESSKEPKGPIYNYFKIRTNNKNIFLLRYNSRFDSWAVLIT